MSDLKKILIKKSIPKGNYNLPLYISPLDDEVCVRISGYNNFFFINNSYAFKKIYGIPFLDVIKQGNTFKTIEEAEQKLLYILNENGFKIISEDIVAYI